MDESKTPGGGQELRTSTLVRHRPIQGESIGPKPVTNDLSRLISYTHHTSEYKQYCHVGNTATQCRLGLFQDSDFEGDLEDSQSTSGEHCAFLEVIH